MDKFKDVIDNIKDRVSNPREGIIDVKFNYNKLILQDDGSLLGKENETTDIRYVRVD